MIYRVAALVAFALFVHITAAHSQARNQLRYLEVLNNTRIQSPKGRVNAYSHFDILLQPRSQHHRIRLSLEPNYDVLGDGATVNYIGADGSITRSETIDRADHKVFKGTTSIENDDNTWTNVGWARISVLRDGIRPLFEGAFSVHHDNHHIQLNSNYMQTRHELDPQLEEEDDNFMVLFRDSDIEQHTHTELKRSVSSDATCLSHQLEFNTRPDHPIFQARLNKDDGQWGSMSMSNVFGKRQFDTQTTGNTAGVNLTQSIGQAQGCPSTRRVALVGVATDCTYTNRFNSTQSTRQNVISVMNAASSAWESTFNISLGLQNLTIMDSSCPGTPQTATPWNQDCGVANLDISARLNLFSQWRGTLKDNNSHWTLLTSCNTGSAVGLAWLGQVCVNDAFTTNTTGGGSETVSGANVVAYTSTEWQVVAHETGHTFGAVHDCTAGTCSDGTTVKSQQCCPHSSSLCSETDQLYIMNPYTTAGITAFSPCTVGNICSAIGRNSVNTQCLSTNKNIVTISGAQCGNGIVEAGEDCDCGGTAGCSDDPCCNPTTCKFLGNAVCDDANDDCCNQCQFSSNGTLCRASTGTCDPAEYCTGSTGICPRDVLAPDGQHCGLSNSSNSNLACASGQCTSRNMQCQTVMSGYFNARTANQTYACDDIGCSLSCASPAFGPGACYGLQQNLLDGTPCAGDGKCYNGNCKGATAGGKIRSWIDNNKAVVIGIAAGVGLLLLIILVSCCTSCIRRSKRNSKVVAGANGNRIARQPMQQAPWPVQQPMQQQQPYNQFQPNYQAPPMPPQYGFYAPPPSSPPGNHESILYGAGIIGSRGSPPPPPPAYSTMMHGAGANSRYT